jgi:hypothetical protein
MDSLAIFLLFLIILFIALIVYLALNPRYEVITQTIPNRIRPPRPLMSQFGPYWSHGGHFNSALIY